MQIDEYFMEIVSRFVAVAVDDDDDEWSRSFGSKPV